MDINKQKERRSIEIVMKYLGKQNYKCEDVSTKGRGYDVLATRNGEVLRIEVKGTWGDRKIPDSYRSDFDDELKLVGDSMYIVELNEDMTPRQMHILSKAEVDRFAEGYRIVERVRVRPLQTALRNGDVGKVVPALELDP
jgi:hypothetical protein